MQNDVWCWVWIPFLIFTPFLLVDLGVLVAVTIDLQSILGNMSLPCVGSAPLDIVCFKPNPTSQSLHESKQPPPKREGANRCGRAVSGRSRRPDGTELSTRRGCFPVMKISFYGHSHDVCLRFTLQGCNEEIGTIPHTYTANGLSTFYFFVDSRVWLLRVSERCRTRVTSRTGLQRCSFVVWIQFKLILETEILPNLSNWLCTTSSWINDEWLKRITGMRNVWKFRNAHNEYKKYSIS